MPMKKWISLLLALCLLLTMTSAFAEGDWTAAEFRAAADVRTELASDYTGKTVILHSNDVHGQIDGYAYIAGLKECFSQLGASDVILADAGDYTQGDMNVIASKGASAVEMMNAAGYDIITLGNHEFDFGYDQMMENLSKATFQTICANVTLVETGEHILPGTCVIETSAGLKLGFLGIVTPETVTKVHPGVIRQVRFTAFDELYAAGQSAVQELQEQKVDLVLGLLHLGMDEESARNAYRSVDFLQRVPGIDFAIDGHSHYVMTAGQAGEPIQSTGTKFSHVGVIVIDNETKKIEDHFLVPTYLGSKLYSAKFVSENVLEKAKEIMDQVDAEYGATFATSEVLLNGDKAPGNRTGETNMGDLITDAMIWYVVREGGLEQTEPHQIVAVVNGGSIRAPITVGDVSRKNINTVLPFGNTLAMVYVTGEELLEALEASTFCTPDSIGGFPQTSGIQWTIDTTKAYDKGAVYMVDGKETSYFAPASIQRVSIQKINGEDFDPGATYAVVTSNFCAAGGDTYNVFVRNSSTFDTGIPLDEVVMAYITDGLGGKIPADRYAAPQGRETEIK